MMATEELKLFSFIIVKVLGNFLFQQTYGFLFLPKIDSESFWIFKTSWNFQIFNIVRFFYLNPNLVLKSFWIKSLVTNYIATKSLISKHITDRLEDYEFSAKPSTLVFKKDTKILASQNALQANLWKVTRAWWAFYPTTLSVHWCKATSSDCFFISQNPTKQLKERCEIKKTFINEKSWRTPNFHRFYIWYLLYCKKTQKIFYVLL